MSAKIIVNQTAVPLNGAKITINGSWVPIKSTDKIYLNGQWYEVGGDEEPVVSYKKIQLVDNQAGIDTTLSPMSVGTFDLSGFGMSALEVVESGPHRVWYGIDNITNYPIIVLDDRSSTPTVEGYTQWLVYLLEPETLGGSTGTAIRYYEQMGTGLDPWEGSGYYCTNGGYTPSPDKIITLTDIDTEPIDPTNIFPN